MARKRITLNDITDYFWTAPIADVKQALKGGAHALRMREPAAKKAPTSRKGKQAQGDAPATV